MKKNYSFTIHNSQINVYKAISFLIISFLIAFNSEFLLRENFVIPISTENFNVQRMLLLYMGILAFSFFIAKTSRINLTKPKAKDVYTMSLTIFLTTLTIKLFLFFEENILAWDSSLPIGGRINLSSFDTALPLACGAILLQAVTTTRVAIIYSFIWSLIISIYFASSPSVVIFNIVSCFVAIASGDRFRTRDAYIRIGFNVFMLSIPITLITVFKSSAQYVYYDFLVRILSGFIGGVACYIFASTLTPIIEHIGSYVTDMSLIEIATLDHPLLKELSIQAPGTWNHSMVMGMMGEMAAREVGANPVLVRTGAYFHDIGKIKKTSYFIENQLGIENPHDKLTPSMSALIIKSHVKEGVEMANEYKLPAPIIDMILQHHGTSKTEFFYNRALKEAEETKEVVDESLYRYLGPKPQTKEAGILMLADCIEAAVRSLAERDVDKMQSLVEKIVNKVFATGQLAECDLTLRDLHIIAKSFLKTLLAIHHKRISYDIPLKDTK